MSNLKMSLVRIIITTIGITYSYELYGFENNRKSMLYAMSLLLFINIVTHFFAYNLIDSVTNNGGWFLTGANALIVYCLPAACVALTSVEVNKERLLSVILLGVAVWTAFLSETATSIFTLTLLTAIVIVQRLIRKNIINLRVGIVAIVSVFIIVVLFQAQGKIFIIRYIVQDLLHRDLDFTARTYIWVESIKQIISSPVLGHGYGYSFRVPVGLSGFTADHAHNQYLQQFIQGGIIQGILFILVIRETIESIKGVNTRKGSCCVPSIIVTGIMFLFEYYFTASINTLFIFFYFYGKYKRENVELSVNAVQW
jgi:O-antigen ligase